MVNLLFSPQGRIASGPFWQGVIILLAAGTVISALQVYVLPPPLALLAALVGLGLIYCTVCVYGKRLHDTGKSAWWVLAIVLANIVLGGVANYFFEAQATAGLDPAPFGTPEWSAMKIEVARKIFVQNTLVGLVISLTISFFIARLASDPGENRFGPPTGITETI